MFKRLITRNTRGLCSFYRNTRGLSHCVCTMPFYRKLSVGLLSSSRLQGDNSWTEARLSANWSPLKWLNGGMNVAINYFTASSGWVLNIHPKGYNFFVGMDHILGRQSKRGYSSHEQCKCKRRYEYYMVKA